MKIRAAQDCSQNETIIFPIYPVDNDRNRTSGECDSRIRRSSRVDTCMAAATSCNVISRVAVRLSARAGASDCIVALIMRLRVYTFFLEAAKRGVTVCDRSVRIPP